MNDCLSRRVSKRAEANIELFAGGGGSAVGLHDAGFSPSHFYELDARSCETLRLNTHGPHSTLAGRVHEGNVKDVKWSEFGQPVRLLAAGAPCQPFSLGGKHLAQEDGRNLFPEVLRAVRKLQPKAVLVENVRGLVREAFMPYFSYVLSQLQYPSIEPLEDETWQEHMARIERHRTAVGDSKFEYQVVHRVVNAADYGVPQVRYRVFIVATRADLPRYTFPDPTHSKEALVLSQLSGEYWDRHNLKRPRPQSGHSGSLLQPKGVPLCQTLLPWRTVREALSGLPKPAESPSADCNHHWLVEGARTYRGHTPSNIDWPSKTIKAGVHGSPGGENTFIDEEGRVRYYTLREASRIQTFPDDHIFSGSRSPISRQIGNAVPCKLAEAIGRPLFELLCEKRTEPEVSVDAAC